MTSLLSAWPRVFNNPIILWDFLVSLRKKSSFFMLFAFLVLGSLGFISIWSTISNYQYYASSIDPYELRRLLFYNYIGQLGFIACILVAFLCSIAINREVQWKSWEILRTSPMNLSSILVGKFTAIIGFIVLIMVSLFPTYSLGLVMGALSPTEIQISMYTTLENIVLIGIFGLYASSRWEKPVRAISFTLFFSFFYFLILPYIFLLSAYARFLYVISSSSIYYSYIQGSSTISGPFSNYLFSFPITFILHILITVLVAGCFLRACIRNLHFLNEYQHLKGDYKERRNNRRKHKDTYDKAFVNRSILGLNLPILLREYYDIFGKSSFKLYREIFAFLLIGSMFLIPFLFFYNSWSSAFENIHMTAPYFMMLSPLLIVPYAVSSFRSEKDQNTWDLLISSPLPAVKIMRQKLFAGILLFLFRFWMLILPWVVLISYSPYTMPYQKSIMWVTVMLIHACAFLFLSVGMLVSIKSRKTTTAFVVGFLIAFLFLLAPSYTRGYVSSNDPNELFFFSPFLLLIYGITGGNEAGKMSEINVYAKYQVLWMTVLSVFLLLDVLRHIRLAQNWGWEGIRNSIFRSHKKASAE